MHIEESSCQPIGKINFEDDLKRGYIPAILIKSKFRFINGGVITYPSSLFIFFLLLLHFLGNPTINHSFDLIDTTIRIVLTFFIMLIWVASPKSTLIRTFKGDIFLMLLSLLFLIVFRIFITTKLIWFDWSFFTSITLFLIANLILFQNRQNAKEDMLSLEYYTLRRFFTFK